MVIRNMRGTDLRCRRHSCSRHRSAPRFVRSRAASRSRVPTTLARAVAETAS